VERVTGRNETNEIFVHPLASCSFPEGETCRAWGVPAERGDPEPREGRVESSEEVASEYLGTKVPAHGQDLPFRANSYTK